MAARAPYETLLAAGVRMYEYQPTTMRAKTFVVDGLWSAITTMNFDNRSLAYNNEVALLPRDAGLGATLDSLFLEDLASQTRSGSTLSAADRGSHECWSARRAPSRASSDGRGAQGGVVSRRATRRL